MSRPPNYEFQEWWNKQRAKDTADDHLLPSSAAEDFRFLSVDINAPASPAAAAEKDRSRSARQLSWIYLLKLHKIAHSFAFLTSGCITLVRTANRRIATAPAANRTESKLYKIIKLFLVLSVFLLVFELVAYFKGWHFSPPSLESEIEYSVEYVYAKWLKIRADYLAPLLQNLTNVCIVLFLIQSVDRSVLVLGCFYIKIRGLKPVVETDYSEDDEKEGVDLESYPMVLVQIPMSSRPSLSTPSSSTPPSLSFATRRRTAGRGPPPPLSGAFVPSVSAAPSAAAAMEWPRDRGERER